MDFVDFLLISSVFISGCYCFGYHIEKQKIPSYLELEFFNVTETIFPSNLEFNIHLSFIDGTLLYSFDSNGNQFIVSLVDLRIPKLLIQFYGVKKYFNLINLCSCKEDCRYESLALSFSFAEKLTVTCNGKSELVKYGQKGEPDKEYPRPAMMAPLGANVWMANTPHTKDAYPNSRQLKGCISGLRYRGHPVPKKHILPYPSGLRECQPACKEDVCGNGGRCRENFEPDKPLCDCGTALRLGDRCNKSLIKLAQFSSPVNSFRIKLSTLKIIMKMSDEKSKADFSITNGNVAVSVNAHGDEVFVSCRLSDEEIRRRKFSTREKEFYVSLEFSRKGMQIQMSGGDTKQTIDTKTDLSDVIFTKLEATGTNSSMDVGYKKDTVSRKWKSLKLPQTKTEGKNPTEKNQGKEAEPAKSVQQVTEPNEQLQKTVKSSSVGYIVTIVIISLVLFSVIMVLFKKNRDLKTRLNKACEYVENDARPLNEASANQEDNTKNV